MPGWRAPVAATVSSMTIITRVPARPGRVWGILALVAVAFPLPWLFALTVLSLVIQRHGGSSGGSELWAYGLIASGGLVFFPVLFFAGLACAIVAITRPRTVGKVFGWVAVAVVIAAIPLAWVGYGVWILNP